MVIKKEEGFSLIEILIVIAIIGILAVVTVVALKPQELFANGRNSRRVADVNALNSAIGQWLNREGLQQTDPFSTLGLTGSGINAVDSSNGITTADGVAASAVTTLTSTGYLLSIPSDPISTNVGYRIGVDNVTTPEHILVCSGDIEITSTYPSSQYPNGVFCLSN